MRHPLFGFLIAAALLTVIATVVSADDSKDETINKDRKRIEGTWRIIALEVNGNKSTDEDAKKLTVVNGADGTWSLHSEGKEVSRGTTNIDPMKSPKTIDIMPTEGGGKDNLHLGIYELGENTRRLCFAQSGKPRPTEFSSKPGSEHILVTFERDKAHSIKRDRQRIEGAWIVVALETNGNKAMDDDAKKLKVVIGADGSWSLTVEGKDVAQGTSIIDPTTTPKDIDFTTTVGDDAGKQSFGIYEVGKTSLKFCVAPPEKERPSDFASMPGSEHVFLTFEREMVK